MKPRFRVERRAFEVETKSISPRMDDSCSVGRECVFILDVASFHGCLSSRFLLHFLTLFFAQIAHFCRFSSPLLKKQASKSRRSTRRSPWKAWTRSFSATKSSARSTTKWTNQSTWGYLSPASSIWMTPGCQYSLIAVLLPRKRTTAHSCL